MMKEAYAQSIECEELNLRAGNNFHNSGIASLFRLL